MKPLNELVGAYNPAAPLDQASTIPASWYTDARLLWLEQQTVFSRSWQPAARLDQLRQPGDYVTTEIGGEPIVIVFGSDGRLRGFFNVCSHHAAAVMTEDAGRAPQLRCPYHGWTYSLEGELKGTPDFQDVCDFDRSENGLRPIEIAVWEKWVFAKIDPELQPPHSAGHGLEIVEPPLRVEIAGLNLAALDWFERRRYVLNCNWKVFVDNYLDGGYHVPHLHKSLDSVLDYRQYTIENGQRYCRQSSPMVSRDDEVGAVRGGDRAFYYWLYPNFMLNYYEGVLDTNLVRPITVDRTEVIFDFYFADTSAAARERNLQSINLGERIQEEDVGICESVQRGLKSRAYEAGRLSSRREAGEHLFHRLLYEDLKKGCQNRER
ncbi:MAG TPA: SRPBCC family protein [Pyrinomonadaceae bacterium]|nr:SRPBCC family protein [Pyrinomonadaceae bacterium]